MFRPLPRPLSLTAVHRFILESRDQEAQDPIEDFEFCAVLLFERNDRWRRRLFTPLLPCIRILSNRPAYTFKVTAGAVTNLQQRRWIEGVPHAGRIDEHEFQLSSRGKRAVVEELCNDASLSDLLKAGAVFPPGGRPYWP